MSFDVDGYINYIVFHGLANKIPGLMGITPPLFDPVVVGRGAPWPDKEDPMNPGFITSTVGWRYSSEEYVARVLAPPEPVKDAWRVRTQVQLATHPYLRGAKSTVSRFVDLVALVDKSLNEPDDFDEFGGYGYLNAMANFGERH